MWYETIVLTLKRFFSLRVTTSSPNLLEMVCPPKAIRWIILFGHNLSIGDLVVCFRIFRSLVFIFVSGKSWDLKSCSMFDSHEDLSECHLEHSNRLCSKISSHSGASLLCALPQWGHFRMFMKCIECLPSRAWLNLEDSKSEQKGVFFSVYNW